MANRNYPASRTFGFNLLPVRLESKFAVGSTGAVSSVQTNTGIQGITRLAVGTYQIQLQDNYASFLSAKITIKSPITGSGVAATALVPGTVYEIITLGTTTQAQWVIAGVPAGITAAPGVSFLAAATSTGTGSSKAIGVSGIATTEIVGDPQKSLSNQPFTSGSGAFITFQCLAATSSSVTTLIPTDPASGSFIYIELLMNNSGVQ